MEKEQESFFAVGYIFIYYWSLLGGWFIVFDALNNNAAAKMGAHYYHYFELLFPVFLDDDYFRTLVYYALFIISFQLMQLLLLKKTSHSPKESSIKLNIEHRSLILFSILSFLLSLFFIYPQLAGAYKSGVSFYLYMSKYPGSTYTLSQIFRTASVIAVVSGLVLLLCSSTSKYFSMARLRFAGIYYTIMIIIVMLYVSALGNRHDLIYSGIFALILYSINTEKKLFKHYALIMLVTALPVFLAELTRAIPLFSAVEDTYVTKFHFKDLDFLGTIISLTLSNEMFAGHMSLYGAMHSHLALTHGSSFENLLSSLVPRVILPERPMDVYQYYISIALNPGTQGFTINHAAGWYLNFGLAGVIAGGVILGTLIALATNYFYMPDKRKKFFRLAQILIVPGLIAFIPLIIRTGPEGYKALLFEGILIPIMIFWISGLPWGKPAQEIK
jgi:hypothetical protein